MVPGQFRSARGARATAVPPAIPVSPVEPAAPAVPVAVSAPGGLAPGIVVVVVVVVVVSAEPALPWGAEPVEGSVGGIVEPEEPMLPAVGGVVVVAESVPVPLPEVWATDKPTATTKAAAAAADINFEFIKLSRLKKDPGLKKQMLQQVHGPLDKANFILWSQVSRCCGKLHSAPVGQGPAGVAAAQADLAGKP